MKFLKILLLLASFLAISGAALFQLLVLLINTTFSPRAGTQHSSF